MNFIGRNMHETLLQITVRFTRNIGMKLLYKLHIVILGKNCNRFRRRSKEQFFSRLLKFHS